jgi:hypothetical protein
MVEISGPHGGEYEVVFWVADASEVVAACIIVQGYSPAASCTAWRSEYNYSTTGVKLRTDRRGASRLATEPGSTGRKAVLCPKTLLRS